MRDSQRNLLIIGGILTVVSAVYMATVNMPNTPTSAMMFPLSILGFFFGIGFILWSVGWMGLEKTDLLK